MLLEAGNVRIVCQNHENQPTFVKAVEHKTSSFLEIQSVVLILIEMAVRGL